MAQRVRAHAMRLAGEAVIRRNGTLGGGLSRRECRYHFSCISLAQPQSEHVIDWYGVE